MGEKFIPQIGKTLTFPDNASPQEIEAEAQKAIQIFSAPKGGSEADALMGDMGFGGGDENAREPIDINKGVNIPKTNPLISAMLGFGRMMPGSDIAASAANAGYRKLSGQSSQDFGDLMNREMSKTKRIAKQSQEENPKATFLGQLAASVPMFTSGMGIAQGATKALGSGLAANAARAALVGNVLSQSADPNLTPGRVAVDSALGAAGEIAGPALQKIGGSETLRKYPQKLVDTAIRPFMQSLPANERFDLAKEIIMRGIKGSAEGMRRWTGEAREVVGKRLGEVIGDKGTQLIKKTTVVDEIAPLIDELKREPATFEVANKIEKYLSTFWKGQPLTVKAAQELKQQLQEKAMSGYKTLDKGGSVQSEVLDYMMKKASGLRKGIEAVVPEAGPVNRELSVLHQLGDVFAKMEKKAASGTGNVSIKDLGAAGIGTVMGGAGAGAAAGTASKFLGTPTGKINFAQFLMKQLENMQSAGGVAQKYAAPAALSLEQTLSQ